MSVSKGKILIVDDEQAIRDLLIQEFVSLGYDVLFAVDGQDAISKITSNKINVVVSDIKMPKVDGITLLKTIKDKSPETEVVIMTGHATMDNALYAMRSGAYDFVQKPFNIDELSALVEKAMEKRELKILLALYESSTAIFSSVKLEELFPVFISLLKNAISSNDVSIFLEDTKKQMYLAASSIPIFDVYRRKLEIFVSKIHQGKSGNYEPLIINSSDITEKFSDIFDSTTEVKSVLVYPMVFIGEIIGYLVFTKTSDDVIFTQSDLRNILVFVSQMVQSINNTKLYEKLEAKIVELQATLLDLEAAKEEIKSLKEVNSCP
ncbi:MAG: response regulator [Endomicrobium sp.]|jgi:CheY-like chemotaxis protein|uniref:response regulator n=1 Tax=Candidatus Endomicrobiellum cubanum TaxID=3242325 RepID=UPI0028297543|nr:response regulator [Endomicrobium sp.]